MTIQEVPSNKFIRFVILPHIVAASGCSRGHHIKEFCKEAMIWRQLRHLPFYSVLENEFNPLLALVAPWMPNGHLVGYLKRNPDVDRVLLVSIPALVI